VSRYYGNCLDIQVGVHQGQRIERVYKAPPAPLDGLPGELRQMIKHSLWFRDLDHSSMKISKVLGSEQLTGNEKDKNISEQVMMCELEILWRIILLQ